MKKKIVIAEYVSTGVNLVFDVLSRGYEPVLLDCPYIVADEDREFFMENRKRVRATLPKGIVCIEENTNYEEVLEQVRALNPLFIIAGSEFGVPYATRLSDDLGLPGNSKKNLKAMTEKDSMHEALRNHGIRHIRGKLIESVDEAKAFYKELGVNNVVVKRVRGVATQGVYLCNGPEEMIQAVEKELSLSLKNGEEDMALLIQEQIIGTEYIVNTVSCNGKHRPTSIWVYDKVKLSNGTNAYNHSMTVNSLNVGHSKLINYAFDVLDAIGIKYGPVHGEFMIDEKGPVLIEVNCRPMGAGLQRKYVEQLFGHHETDCVLDAYLSPEKFDIEYNKPYRPLKKGAIKDIILPNATIAESSPIIPISKHLRSFDRGVFGRVGREYLMGQTRDLETSGGTLYLVHEDEQVVINDCNLLHMIEMKYPNLIFQSIANYAPEIKPVRNIEKLMNKLSHGGSTLIYSDQDMDIEGATVIGEKELKSAYDSYEQGILDLSKSETFCDLEIIIQQIYQFANKIRKGGHIIIPESTYCNLPYGIEGMEILLKIAGFQIECPKSGMGNILIASIN